MRLAHACIDPESNSVLSFHFLPFCSYILCTRSPTFMSLRASAFPRSTLTLLRHRLTIPATISTNNRGRNHADLLALRGVDDGYDGVHTRARAKRIGDRQVGSQAARDVVDTARRARRATR